MELEQKDVEIHKEFLEHPPSPKSVHFSEASEMFEGNNESDDLTPEQMQMYNFIMESEKAALASRPPSPEPEQEKPRQPPVKFYHPSIPKELHDIVEKHPKFRC